MMASADNAHLFLPERADGRETRLWALQAECSMLAFCLAWDGRERVGGAFRMSGQCQRGSADSEMDSPFFFLPSPLMGHGRLASSSAAPASSFSNALLSEGISTRRVHAWRSIVCVYYCST